MPHVIFVLTHIGRIQVLDTDLNTVCGEHFSDAESRRLRPEAKPVFSLRLSTAAHDHPMLAQRMPRMTMQVCTM